jgi:hypothetical protein
MAKEFLNSSTRKLIHPFIYSLTHSFSLPGVLSDAHFRPAQSAGMIAASE